MKYSCIKIYYIRPNINGFFFHLHVSFLFLTASSIFFYIAYIVGRLNVGLSRIIKVDYLYTKCNFLCMILYIFVKGCECIWLVY